MGIKPLGPVLRKAHRAATAKHKANIAANPIVRTGKDGAPLPLHGEKIWVYNHMHTNQVVYSLSKTVKNNHALAQLPYNGKKTVPRAIRKDHWFPLAQITFPSASQGLTSFRLLREFRTLHETLWDRSLALEQSDPPAAAAAALSADGGGGDGGGIDSNGGGGGGGGREGEANKPLSRKLRGRRLCDQKANSVADMAAVLGRLDLAVGERTRTRRRAEEAVLLPKEEENEEGAEPVRAGAGRALTRAQRLNRELELAATRAVAAKRAEMLLLLRRRSRAGAGTPPAAAAVAAAVTTQAGGGAEAAAPGPRDEGAVDAGALEATTASTAPVDEEQAAATVLVEWRDLADAGFAESWSDAVEHGVWEEKLPSSKRRREEAVEGARGQQQQQQVPAELYQEKKGSWWRRA